MPGLCRRAGHTEGYAEKLLAVEGSVVGRVMEEGRSGDWLGAKQRDAERARARKEFVFERVVSCSQRWRTKLNFRRREPFDNGHGGTTLRTAPGVAELGGESISLELLFWRCPQCLETERQGGGTLAVGQKTEVASSRWVAKQWRSVWGCRLLRMPARLAASRQACQTVFVSMG